MRVVLSSLDGSLLDPHTNSYGAARQALSALERRSIPLILIGQRTRAQLEQIRQLLNVEHPFISEDGAALYLPEHYFPESILDDTWSYQPPYFVQVLGLPYARLRQILQEIRTELQADLVGFGDWTAAELAVALGISSEDARLAQEREYSEVFSYAGDPTRLEQALAQQEQNLVGYKLQLQPLPLLTQLDQWYLTGPVETAATATVPLQVKSHARQAVQILLDCYQRHLGSVVSLGLGSAPMDGAFLKLTRYSIVLPSPQVDTLWAEAEDNWRLAELPGSAGWNEAVLMWLEETDHGDE